MTTKFVDSPDRKEYEACQSMQREEYEVLEVSVGFVWI
jgi:hypothetical protein